MAIFDNLSPSSGTITVTIWRNAGSFDFLNGFTLLEKGTVTGAIQDAADSNYVYDAIGNLVKDKTEKIDSIYWTVYGKISEIAKTPAGSSTVQKIKYTYDASGNRISKLVIKQGADSTYTQYVRDAQGNVMAVYSSNTLKADSLLLNEHHLYGSSRLGIVNRELNVSQPAITGTSLNLMGMSYLSSFERGRKFFELSNHLGNVLVTVSDKKIGFDLNGDGKVDYYTADIVSANDYYPFGMGMVGRKYNAPNSSYRYGFNGKEKDNDVSGEGNQYDYGFRIYNPRLGRFLSVDPLSGKYPWYTPYQFAGNKPTLCIDLDGAEEQLPYIQSTAFDCIKGATPKTNFVRGKVGDKLATTIPDKTGAFENFLRSVSPMYMAPIQPASHIAQAINFGNSVGSVVYDYEESEKGNIMPITNAKDAFMSNSHTVYVNISGYSEIGQAVVENLRISHGLKELSDAEIADYVSQVKFKFSPGKDFSNLFWKQVGGDPQLQLSEIGPTAIPFSPSIPVVLPPLSGTNAVNGKSGDITVSNAAIAKEISETLVPYLVQMSKDKTQRPDEGYATPEALTKKRQELKDYLIENNGKKDTRYKELKKKLEKNEKIIGERNKEKRASN